MFGKYSFIQTIIKFVTPKLNKMASKKPATQEPLNIAKTPERSTAGNLPPEMAADLQECFDHYLEEGAFTIPDNLFRNIL